GEDLKALQEALTDMYLDRTDAIREQNDFGALAYIEGCLGKGPTRRLTDAIDAAAASEEWGGHFMLPESLIMVDGDKDDDERDSIFEDLHYNLDSNGHRIKTSAPIRTIEFLSGLQIFDPPSDFISSQDSGILEPEAGAKILQGALEALGHAREHILRQRINDIVENSDAMHYAALLRNQLDVLNDSMLSATGT
ncbi:hypothetical protein BGZ51_004450, partial [Haplosporangium sp. Z 767]